ncbi:alpha/beta fold hydrolase [Streptomyces harbinensis]|uniref:alpha/beta hydrolase family protein n=1 Tax=Streptomyces harbinensis TaxID=1176198 RepID=UPI0034DE4DD6
MVSADDRNSPDGRDGSGAQDELLVTFDDASTTTVRLFRAERPDAPVVLFLPAMGVRASYYEVLADVLVEEGVHVALADHRGHGGSSVRASRRNTWGYADLLERELPGITDAVRSAFGAEEIVLAGHSLGGQLALLYAATAPHGIARAAVIGTGTAWHRTVSGREAVGRWFGVRLTGVVAGLWGYLPQWFPFAGREARHVIHDWVREGRTGRYDLARTETDYEAALAKTTVPTLFLGFERDPLVPPAGLRHIADKVTAAPVTLRELSLAQLRLKEPSHYHWARRPQAVADALTEWMAQP